MLATDKINLENISFLIVDDNPQSLDILAQVIVGFGARNITRCDRLEDARAHLQRSAFDFVIAESNVSGEDGYQLIEWMRRNGAEANRFAPAVIVSGHTPFSQVTRARDCGAHCVVIKPIAPRVVLDRIFWIGREQRLFIESDTYFGPDRRFRHDGPPMGMAERRADESLAGAAPPRAILG